MNEITQALIQSLIIGTCVGAVHWFLSKRKSLEVKPPIDEKDITPEQRENFRTYGVAEGFTFICTTALSTYLLRFPLGIVFDYFVYKPEHEKLISMPIEGVFLVSMALSIVLQMRFSTYLMRPFYKKEDIAVYQYLATQQMRFDTYKVMRNISIWCGLIILLFFVKCIQATHYLTSDNIVINDFLSLKSKTYPIEDLIEFSVAKKQRAPNGNIVNRNEFIMKFKDGYVWRLDQNGNPQTTEFVKTLLSKSFVIVNEVELYEQ